MKTLDSKTINKAFASVSHSIEYQFLLVNDKAEVAKTRTFFEETIPEIALLIEKGEPYVPADRNLRRVLEFAGYSFRGSIPEQKGQLEKAAAKFREYATELEILEKNPKKLYSEEPQIVSELFNICRKMDILYDRITSEEEEGKPVEIWFDI